MNSAVDQTGNRARAKSAESGGGAAVPLSMGELGPHLTQCRLGQGLPPHQVASWSIKPFGHNKHGPKWGAAVSLFGEGELGPHPTQCRLGQGQPPYQVASWSIQPFGHNRHGLKIGGCAPLGEGELGHHLRECGQGRGLPPCQVSSWSIQPFGHNTPTWQTDRTDRQRCDSIGRTVLQMVAQKLDTMPCSDCSELFCNSRGQWLGCTRCLGWFKLAYAGMLGKSELQQDNFVCKDYCL